MGRKKAGVVPIVLSCWSVSGEAVGGVFVRFVVLWDGTGLNNRTGLDTTVSSCGNTSADTTVSSCGNTSVVRDFVVRSVLAQYGCCYCTTAAMTIMRTEAGPLLLLLLWSGMSIPGVLFAIPWLVLLWHALGLVGCLFASAFIEFR